MKKLTIAAMIAAGFIANPATARADQCARWSPVYAKTQTDLCTCNYVRDRGGRRVLNCSSI
ncbi:MAG: hypothetical protein ABL914_10965 [Novosphingobium sp.]|uniref:hypothetical protein n=1 Tax=Novosphingobium sp. TaxID=1874826 RepID=UPI0032BDEF70